MSDGCEPPRQSHRHFWRRAARQEHEQIIAALKTIIANQQAAKDRQMIDTSKLTSALDQLHTDLQAERDARTAWANSLADQLKAAQAASNDPAVQSAIDDAVTRLGAEREAMAADIASFAQPAPASTDQAQPQQ